MDILIVDDNPPMCRTMADIFIFAGYDVETAVTGQSYEAYVHWLVLQPIGMQNTSFIYSADLGNHEAIGRQPLINLYNPLRPFRQRSYRVSNIPATFFTVFLKNTSLRSRQQAYSYHPYLSHTICSSSQEKVH